MSKSYREVRKSCTAQFQGTVPGNLWLLASRVEMEECVAHNSLSFCPLVFSLVGLMRVAGVSGLRLAKNNGRVGVLAVTKGTTTIDLPLTLVMIHPSHPQGVYVAEDAALAAWNAVAAAPGRKSRGKAKPDTTRPTKRVQSSGPPSAAVAAVAPQHLTPLQQVRHALNERYIERAYEVQLLLVAAVSKSHCFFLGPPGTGKTDLTQDFAKCVGGTVFDTLVSAGTSRDELEGPMNTKILTEEGRQVRLRQGYMSEATFAVVDEIWKSSPFLLNSMLRLMSQRTYFEDGKEHAAKTRCVLAASNETPQDKSLEALYSRFSLRCYCDSIVGDEGRAQLLGIQEWNRPSLPQSVIGSLTEADLDAERQKALALPLTKAFGKVWLQCLDALSTLHTGPRTRGIRIDDRRLRNLMEVAKVWAHLDGKKSVGPEYALILADTAWNTPGERQLVEAEIYSRSSVSHVVSDSVALGDQIMAATTESLIGNGKGPVVQSSPVPVQGDPNGTIEALVADRVRKAAVKASKSGK